jgi:hypothetical protein
MKTKQQILTDYKIKAQEILYQMVQLLAKEQKKVDNKTYRKLLKDFHLDNE